MNKRTRRTRIFEFLVNVGRAFSLGVLFVGFFLSEKAVSQTNPSKKFGEKFWTFIWEPLDATQADLSKRIFGVSQTVDSFFGDDRIENEVNSSVVRLNYLTTVVESEPIRNDFRIKTKLALPRTQRRLNLVLESVRDLGREEVDRVNDVLNGEGGEVSAALRYIVFDSQKWNFHTDGGIKARIPLDPFGKFRLRYRTPIGDWEHRITETVLWFDSSGWEAETEVTFDREINENWFFRFINTTHWKDEESTTKIDHSINWFQKIDEDKGFSYHIGAGGNNRPNIHVESYYVSIGYRKRIHKDWMFFNVSTGFQFPRAREWEATPFIIFNLEALFGSTS